MSVDLRDMTVAAVMSGSVMTGVAACGHVEAPPQKGKAAIEAPTIAQRAAFGALANLAGQSFVGEPNGAGDDAVADVQKWEWALDGSVLKCTHALEDGSYGGETLIYTDAKTEQLTYIYVTNAGFHTSGTMVLNTDGSWTGEEAVEGHPEISRVRSTGYRDEAGRMISKSEYFKNGTWVDGHHFTYMPMTGAEPAFTPAAGE